MVQVISSLLLAEMQIKNLDGQSSVLLSNEPFEKSDSWSLRPLGY